MFLPLPLFGHVAYADHSALMQVGPNPSQQQASPLPIPRRRKVVETPAPAAPAAKQDAATDRLSDCLLRAQRDPAAGLAFARGWVAEGATPQARIRANNCLGVVLSQQGDFAGAEAAFGEAIAAIPPEQAAASVDLLAMAGNAALAAGHADRALDWLDKAVAAGATADKLALGVIQSDRARTLVALGRVNEAASALDEVHRLAPEDASGWLLSATLARRNKDLPRAQRDIEVAASLDPRDPAIGVEAGVIAMLDGREASARKSWESVVKSAPASAEAKTAAGYLEQIGPAPTSGAPAAEKPVL